MFTHQNRFWLTAVALFIGTFLLARAYPLIPYFDHVPTVDGRFFAPSLGGGLFYLLLLCWLFGMYGLAVRLLKRLADPPRLWQLSAATIFIGIPLIFTYPLNANDIYRYFIRGRISAVYEKNSFTTGPADFPADPYLPYAGEWAEETTPYGPVWEMAAWGITSVTPHNLLAALLAFKLFGLLLHTAIGWLTARSSLHPARTFLLWAWNPALLLIFVMNGHNDALMLFWLMLGCWLIHRDKVTIGFIVMMLAPLTKIIGLLPLPFFFISIMLGLENGSSRLKFLLITLISGAGLSFLTFLPFGSPLDLLWRLLREAGDGAGFSPMTLFVMAARAAGWPLSLASLSNAGLIALALFALFLLWKGVNGRSPLRNSTDIFLGYLAQALNYRIWYAAWPFPWLIADLDESKASQARLTFGLWFLFTSQLSVFIYTYFRIYFLNGDQLWTHVVGVLFTFGLPFGVSRYASSK